MRTQLQAISLRIQVDQDLVLLGHYLYNFIDSPKQRTNDAVHERSNHIVGKYEQTNEFTSFTTNSNGV